MSTRDEECGSCGHDHASGHYCTVPECECAALVDRLSRESAIVSIITLLLAEHPDFSNVSYDGDHNSASVIFTYDGQEFILSSKSIEELEEDDDE